MRKIIIFIERIYYEVFCIFIMNIIIGENMTEISFTNDLITINFSEKKIAFFG